MIQAKGIPILMYHYIGEPKEPEDVPYYVSAAAFESQMRLLKRWNFHTISLQELIDHLFGGLRLPKRSIVITFDDGHQSFSTKACPILTHYGFTATMFLVTSRLGSKGSNKCMKWEDVEELSKQGFSFESHSRTHPILTQVDTDRVHEEIVGSKADLEQKLSEKIHFFCYRGGHYNDQIKEIVRRAGYSAAVCSTYGRANGQADRYALNRIPVRGPDDLLTFWAKVHGWSHHSRLSRWIARFMVR